MQRPLADEIRPKNLDEVVGQRHLLAPGAVLRRLIEKEAEANMVFYGPSGTGKTTIANIIAQKTHKTLYRLNATTASLQDIKDIIADVGTLMAPGGVLLYLDEIQYFNKKQQQSLLEFMENGKLTLIASTTENPYFYVYSALLSRSTVFEFKAVPAAEAEPAVLRALEIEKDRAALPLDWEDGLPLQIATACGGDVRKAVNAVELLCNAALPRDGKLYLTRDDAAQLAQKSAMRYDKGGDAMYDIASALMKSLRGSDPDAALHYLARFLEAGDLVTPCRRLLCSASEDVGMAYPQAAAIVKACVDTAMQLGLPEAQLPLAQAAILLATAPKSNSVVEGIGRARADVRAGRTGDVPRQLQNVHADTTGFDHQQHYLYPHNFPKHWVAQQYLPDALKDIKYYVWGENKTEQAAKAYWEKIKGEGAV
ncbi:MAG: replication-associated recombination protein A [Oscillibacter sp.]|jgi:putative ATPase|nr:replication-associated recombination protein A [Oscillibacter sp.]